MMHSQRLLPFSKLLQGTNEHAVCKQRNQGVTVFALIVFICPVSVLVNDCLLHELCARKQTVQIVQEQLPGDETGTEVKTRISVYQEVGCFIVVYA